MASSKPAFNFSGETSTKQFSNSLCFTCIFRLFHILVDSDKTAAQILSIMNKHKLPGEVTFMPLNKLLSKEQQHPTSPVSNTFCTITVDCTNKYIELCTQTQCMFSVDYILSKPMKQGHPTDRFSKLSVRKVFNPL